MSNALPEAQDALFNLADDMIDGLDGYEAAAQVKQFTKATLEPLLAAARSAQQAYGAAQLAETRATGARNVANSNVKGYLAAGKNALLPALGSRPSQAWETLGYPAGSIAMPDSVPARLAVLAGMQAYLAANPGKEVQSEDIAFTAARAETLRAALAKARADLNDAVAARADTRAPRESAVAALRNAMSGLAEELGRLLADDSALWYHFGLVPPAGEERPGIPDGLLLRPAGPGTVIAAVAASPRAQNYRFAIQVEGRDAGWLDQPLVSEPQLVIEGLPAAGKLKVQVRAHNAAGDSAASEPAEIPLA